MVGEYFSSTEYTIYLGPIARSFRDLLDDSCIIINNLYTPSAHLFWIFSHDDAKITTDIFFHEGTDLIFYMRLPGQRRALRFYGGKPVDVLMPALIFNQRNAVITG